MLLCLMTVSPPSRPYLELKVVSSHVVIFEGISAQMAVEQHNWQFSYCCKHIFKKQLIPWRIEALSVHIVFEVLYYVLFLKYLFILFWVVLPSVVRGRIIESESLIIAFIMQSCRSFDDNTYKDGWIENQPRLKK